MQVPGRDGLLVGLRLTPAGAPAAERITHVEVRDADERTGAVRVTARFDGPEGAAEAELRTFLCRPVPAPTRASVMAELAPGNDLTGCQVLVSGASRGFGAALAGALAVRGATVWALYARSDDAARALRREFGPANIRPVCCDVTDPKQVSAASARLVAEDVRLDGIVLSAAPPPHPIGTAPQAVGAALDHVRRSLEMALRPLAEWLPHVRPADGWLVAISSSAVTAIPDGWGHYAAAKAALEAYTSYYGRRHGLRTLLLRAPKMRTDLVNGPTGRVGAQPPERVAAAVVDWITGTPSGGREPTLLEPDDILADRERP
jgi:NAD(P)-dependent dehydrogenase (short-subunit alcohol dehydrogenase family)